MSMQNVCWRGGGCDHKYKLLQNTIYALLVKTIMTLWEGQRDLKKEQSYVKMM